MNYLELKEKQSHELNNFPMMWAFNEKQFNEGLERLRATKENLCRIPGGGFIKKTDAKAFEDMFIRHRQEMDAAISDDEFLTEALTYELSNHEYCITWDATDALNTLGIDRDNMDDRTKKCLATAKLQQ